MIILDTNVISAIMVPDLNPVPLAWLDKQPRNLIWTTAINVLENRAGLLLLPIGKRRTAMIEIYDRLLSELMDQRILAFDALAAEISASVSAKRIARGINITTEDTQIAGIALAHGATLATRNVKDFADLDIPLVNPWAGRPA